MENVENYIKEKMDFYAGNISDFEIGETVIRKKDNKKCKISDMTKNSLEIYTTKSGKDGINCTQWINMQDFKKQYKKI